MLTTLHVHHSFLYISFPSLHDRDVIMPMDCKTVRIFAYSSTREQSNKRSGTRLKTESKTGERRWKYDFFLSLHTPYGHVRLASFASVKTITPRFIDFFTDFEKKKPGCFAVYNAYDFLFLSLNFDTVSSTQLQKKLPTFDELNKMRGISNTKFAAARLHFL